MKKTTTNWTTKILTNLAAGLVLSLAVPAFAQSPASMEQIHARAVTANTAGKHAAVARDYRLQSEALAAKAEAHEKEAARLTRASGAIVHKWPAMASRHLQREKALAVEARRAQREAQQLADYHVRLSVEAQADTAVMAGD